MIATVTSKGQITIPLEVRERHGIHAGTRVEFVSRPDGTVDFIPLTGSMADLAGIIPAIGRIVTIDEMDAAIGDSVLGRS